MAEEDDHGAVKHGLAGVGLLLVTLARVCSSGADDVARVGAQVGRHAAEVGHLGGAVDDVARGAAAGSALGELSHGAGAVDDLARGAAAGGDLSLGSGAIGDATRGTGGVPGGAPTGGFGPRGATGPQGGGFGPRGGGFGPRGAVTAEPKAAQEAAEHGPDWKDAVDNAGDALDLLPDEPGQDDGKRKAGR